MLRAGELLFRILLRISQEEQLRQKEPLAIRAAEMIRKNAENPEFSVSSLAPALQISGAYLRRFFREEYGMSPKQYLTRLRMEMAASLLETGFFTIREVALRSGFVNEKYFATAFHQHCGVPPSEYGQ